MIQNEMHINPENGEFVASVFGGAAVITDKDGVRALDMSRFGVKITKTGEADTEMIVDGSVAAKEISASDMIHIQRSDNPNSYEVFVDNTTGDIVCRFETADGECKVMYTWSFRDGYYQMFHRSWRKDTGELVDDTVYRYKTEAEMKESLLRTIAVDFNTGKIVDSLYNGKVVITVEDEYTHFDLSNALFDFKDRRGNVVARVDEAGIRTNSVASVAGENGSRLQLKESETVFETQGKVVAKVDKNGVKTDRVASLSDESISMLEYSENGDRSTLTIGEGLEMIKEGVEKGIYIYNQFELIVSALRAGIMKSESLQFSETGIDMDYDNTKTNPDTESKITITAGQIELKTLNSNKGIIIFGKTYKGIANKNDPTTWTSEYLIDASILANFEARISALENRN